ncbi:MAG: chemotaxis protein CheA, partial [Alphaproteobacteria bacterium]
MDDTHFDAVAGHLRATLQELEVPEDLIIDVLTVVEKTRKDVLGIADASEDAATAEKVTGQEAAEEAVNVDGASETQSASQPSIAKQNIRVNIGLLENLMNLVSELVLTRNQLLQMVRGKTDSEFAEPLQRLSHATTELQEGVMKTRMQPIGNAWNPFPRIVRNLALELDKKIDLQMLGAETELDRQVLELIKDPLTHMVRNSGDHGIETPAERKAAGKSETGTITLNAYHEGGHIIIEVTDDGRGIAVDKVKAKAIANGLATEAELEGMTEKQIQQFIFKPGFSTAETVTNVSGRGVGMDVVKTNIEKIGGTVELKSVEGKGSAFIVKIPLTLAIVSALVVECAGERFAIPQTSVVELVRASGNSEHTIEMINNAPVLRLRERLLPLVSLRDLLALDDADQSTSEGEGENDEREAFIIVTSVGAYSIGIVVDKVYDTEEIVVKPVS